VDRVLLDKLLAMARSRMRLALLLLTLAISLSLWLVIRSASEPEPMFCGVVDPEEPDVLRQRWAVSDAARLAPWRERLGREPDLKNGSNVFKTSCAACHKPDKDMTGPALQGLLSRAPQPALEWYLAFMQHEDSLIKAGDTYTLALREQWGHSSSLHPNELTRKELLDALVFVELYESRPVH
jgi:mono/diheme cytochrome c family protein